MKKTLIVYRDTATEALDHLDKFAQKMSQFIEEHPTFAYESSLKRRKEEKDWEITVTIEDNEK
jgi:hypothetical protein